MVQLPDPGKPVKTTLPVETVQEGWVTVPIRGAFGTLTTVKVLLAVPVHPAAEVTVTIYVPGVDTEMEGVANPLFQRYVCPPVVVNVVLDPLHTDDGPSMITSNDSVQSRISQKLANIKSCSCPFPTVNDLAITDPSMS